MQWRTNRIAELETELEALPAGAPEAAPMKEELILARLNLDAAEANEKPVFPNKTFTDRKVLKMGNATFELYYIGGMHSSSDIAILVPEHGLLMTGDTMADVWLTETAGCLASFVARDGVKHDFPLLLKNWNTILERHDDYAVLLPGHWNGTLSYEGFEKRVNYVETLWVASNKAADSKMKLDDFMAANQFAERFPELVDSPGCTAGNHYTTMLEMYSETTGMQSAAVVLYDLLAEGAEEKEIRKVVAQFGADYPDYYFMENQLNGYGYRFVHYEKYDEAVQLFRINVELYPDSWNVYDSLGEALYARGDLAEAEAMYVKSVELNPESPTGEEALRKIRQDMSVN
jgi:tetratricopeptide (TPR) repeat protein